GAPRDFVAAPPFTPFSDASAATNMPFGDAPAAARRNGGSRGEGVSTRNGFIASAGPVAAVPPATSPADAAAAAPAHHPASRRPRSIFAPVRAPSCCTQHRSAAVGDRPVVLCVCTCAWLCTQDFDAQLRSALTLFRSSAAGDTKEGAERLVTLMWSAREL